NSPFLVYIQKARILVEIQIGDRLLDDRQALEDEDFGLGVVRLEKEDVSGLRQRTVFGSDVNGRRRLVNRLGSIGLKRGEWENYQNDGENQPFMAEDYPLPFAQPGKFRLSSRGVGAI